MQEVDNIIRILKESKEAVEQNNSYKLRNLSDQTIHSAAVYQDADNIIVAVLVYSLGKIMERDSYKSLDGWKSFYKRVLDNLKQSVKFLEKNDLENFRKSIGEVRSSINEISGSLGDYIKDVFYKAEITKAFKIYEHGISSEATASLLGVSLWDLSGYIGQTTISESHLNEAMSVKERIKLAQGFFK